MESTQRLEADADLVAARTLLERAFNWRAKPIWSTDFAIAAQWIIYCHGEHVTALLKRRDTDA